MTIPQVEQAKRRYEMPFLLLCGLGLSAFFAVMGALVVIGILFSTLLGRAGSYSINGRAVPRAVYFAAVWPLYLIFPLILVIVAAIAYTLWREDPRSRMLMLGYWTLAFCVSLGTAIAQHETDIWVAGVLPALFLIGLAWAYLYRKKNVVAYYALLKRTQARATDTTVGNSDPSASGA